jgi:glucose-1-phosphate thymidylyltransferase
VHYVHQVDRQGVGHAIRLTRSIVNQDEVMVVLGDTICEYDVQEVMNSPYSMIGVKKVDDPRDFGVAEIEENGFISHVVEKPHIPKSNMALVGVYKIKESDQMFQCLENNIRQGLRSHGEYGLTDALDCMIQMGARFQSFKVESWFDCGKKETMLESNAVLLKKFAHQTDTSQFENTVIIQPVCIAKGCNIKIRSLAPTYRSARKQILIIPS